MNKRTTSRWSVRHAIGLVVLVCLSLNAGFYWRLHSKASQPTTYTSSSGSGSSTVVGIPPASARSYQYNTHTAKQQQSTIDYPPDTNSDSFSACLLVMDDNHFLIEWLAYHYHVMPLRRLIVAVDPRSSTSPKPVLNRWQGLDSPLVITQWTGAEIYNDTERLEAESWIKTKFPDSSPALVQHRARQRLFYYKCMQQLKREGQSWCLLTDSDEYVRVNTQQLDRLGLAGPSIERPGSVLEFIQQDQTRPNQNLTTIPCIQIPRLRYTPVIDALDQYTAPGSLNASAIMTLSHVYRVMYNNNGLNRVSKAIVDLSRVSWDDLAPVDSIHLPIRSFCGHRRLYLRADEHVLVIHHYLGTWEQYWFRDDSRKGDQRSEKVRMCMYKVLYE
jgi:hypothetical protein